MTIAGGTIGCNRLKRGIGVAAAAINRQAACADSANASGAIQLFRLGMSFGS